jgi:hypothetical protein
VRLWFQLIIRNKFTFKLLWLVCQVGCVQCSAVPCSAMGFELKTAPFRFLSIPYPTGTCELDFHARKEPMDPTTKAVTPQ